MPTRVTDISSAKLLAVLRARARGQKTSNRHICKAITFIFLVCCLYACVGYSEIDYCANTMDRHECEADRGF